MNKETESLSPRSLTPIEEKVRRFDYINGQFMSKYLDLVWYARSNPEELVEKEEYEVVEKVMKSIKDIQWKHPEETLELEEDETGWQHGFNSGVLAYARFISSYVEDTLWEVCEHNLDMVEHEKVIVIDGKEYIEFDGRADAEENFPELYT